MLLTNEQLERRKKEAREEEIRQNVKSHCTKIRDGIRENGSTSGNRAIWELFQNARDLSNSAEVKITLTNREFIFAHKGKPFTYDSLCSLVKQVSSHEKEDNNSVGQYGTGFLTTHKFGRKIIITGSMQINKEPNVYVEITNFEINRENFDDIPTFIDDMKKQILEVDNLMDAEQKDTPQEWTELHYNLNEEREQIAKDAIEQAIKLMPYVLTFNDHISCCSIYLYDESCISFSKEDKETSIPELKCKRIVKSKNGKKSFIDCYYLELDNGDSRIILPLKNETEVCYLGDVPRLFVHFPLIGANHFNINFLFHSHRFTPEEQRDNIIVPKDNDATDKIAFENKRILDSMTNYLWSFLEEHVHTWREAIKMASVNIKDNGFTEQETGEYYSELKKEWVKEFQKLKLIEINGNRYSMNDDHHPVVFDPSLEAFLSNNSEKGYLDTIYPYANGAMLVPCKEEIMEWSKIIGAWDKEGNKNYITLEDIVKYVSQNKGDKLLDMLNLLVTAGKESFFDKYALIPNREGVLHLREELRDARTITSDLYARVKAIDNNICSKMVDKRYEEVIKLASFSRQKLREELNEAIKRKEDECWKNEKRPYAGEFEHSLIALCSCFTTKNGDSKRNKIMPIICRFENIEYEEKYIPAATDDPAGFDLYRQLFISLVENQMKKIEQKDVSWVKANMTDLISFVDYARGDDYKNFCTQYAIYPDMNGELHRPEDLKKNQRVSDKLFELYQKVICDDLKSKCVDSSFERFFSSYENETYQHTPRSVAKEIQNKLSDGQYKDTIILDIIELTEKKDTEGENWRTLFKDIYEQRESIRYKLGTPDERSAINKMMQKKNPKLLVKLAEVAENNDADEIIKKIDKAIEDCSHEEHIKMLGRFVEVNVERIVREALKDTSISVKNEQGGQDLILSKNGFKDYYIEIKSRWKNSETAIMSALQFSKAVDNPQQYSLISAQMWTIDQQRAKREEILLLDEIEPLLKVCNNIGSLEADLKGRVDEAFKGEKDDIRIVGSYDVHVPQKVFDSNFSELISTIKEKFK